MESFASGSNESTSLTQTIKHHRSPVIKHKKSNTISIQNMNFISAELSAGREKPILNLGSAFLNYEAEMERINHSETLLKLLKRKLVDKEYSPVKSKEKYYKRMLSFYDKVVEGSKSGSTSMTCSPKKSNSSSRGSNKKVPRLNQDSSEIKMTFSTPPNAQRNKSFLKPPERPVKNMALNSNILKLKMKNFMKVAGQNSENKSRQKQKFKVFERNLDSYKVWRK